MTKMHFTRAVLPSLLLVFYLPLVQTWLLPEGGKRQIWEILWQWFPVTHSATQFAMSKFWKDTADADKISRPKRDVGTIRYTIGIPTIISMFIWLYTLYTFSTSLSQVFLPQDILTSTSFTKLEVTQLNFLIAIGSAYLWFLYFISDTKPAGMVSQSWVTVAAAMLVGTVVLGPGGVVGIGFLWREYVITEKRHWGALTVERVREMEGQKIKETR